MTLAAPTSVQPVTIANVVVPMASSAYSRAALVPAAALARCLDAGLLVVGVGIEQAEADQLEEVLRAAAEGLHATIETGVDWDVPGQLLKIAAQHEPSIICMASHARGRFGGMVAGSIAAELLSTAHDPVVLVGPHLDAERSLTDGPVVVCVDGSSMSEQAIPGAAAWAMTLQQSLEIVTVAEPAPRPLDNHPVHRGHGPRQDPQGYVKALAEAWSGRGVAVSGSVIYDPVSVGDGMAGYLRARPAGLVAVTTHGRIGLARTVLGSQAAAVVRLSPVPVVVTHPQGR